MKGDDPHDFECESCGTQNKLEIKPHPGDFMKHFNRVKDHEAYKEALKNEIERASK